jgi:hypothetical protein
MAFIDFVGTVGFILCFILISGPFPSLSKGIQEMEIKNLTLYYFLAGMSQAAFWSGFGHKTDDFYMWFANDAVFFIFLIYLLMFLYIKRDNVGMIYYGLGMLIFYLLTQFVIPAYLCLFSAAVISCVWGSTTLVTLKSALTTKDVGFINIFLSYVSFTNFFVWTVYAFLINYTLSIIPNLWNTILWALNIFIYYWAQGCIGDDNFAIVFLKKIFGVDSNDNNNTSGNNSNRIELLKTVNDNNL